MIFYHGTPNAQKILKHGIDIEHLRLRDVGDFGYGLYLTKNLSRARNYGTILKIKINPATYAYIKNPYFLDNKCNQTLPQTQEEYLFYSIAFDDQNNMLTVSGSLEKRLKTSKAIRKIFLQYGYGGIITNLYDREAVILIPTLFYRLNCINFYRNQLPVSTTTSIISSQSKKKITKNPLLLKISSGLKITNWFS